MGRKAKSEAKPKANPKAKPKAKGKAGAPEVADPAPEVKPPPAPSAGQTLRAFLDKQQAEVRAIEDGSAQGDADAPSSTHAESDSSSSEEPRAARSTKDSKTKDSETKDSKTDDNTKDSKTDDKTKGSKIDDKSDKIKGSKIHDKTGKPDGELDERSYSKQQKRVFDNHFKELDKNIQQEWSSLSQPGGPPGKQARKNQIVNMCVPRDVNYAGKIEVKSMTFEKSFKIEDKKSHESEAAGISMTAMKLKYRDLFDEAKDRKDIWEEDDGLWYEKKVVKTRKLEAVDKKETSKQNNVADSATMLALEAEMSVDMFAWTRVDQKQIARGSSSSKGMDADDDPANDDLLLRLQESFDAITRLTQIIKKHAQEIMQVATVTEAGMSMVRKGKELLKGLSDPTEEIENLLTSPRPSVTVKKAIDALQKAATPFLELEKFSKELEAIHKVYVPKIARARRPQIS